MSWSRKGWPSHVLRLAAREPGLCARVLGWRETNDAQELLTRDVQGRAWLWRLHRSQFVDQAGEVRGPGFGAFDHTWVWVPVFGPVHQHATVTPADILRDAVDLLEAPR